MNKYISKDFPFFMAMPAVAWHIVFFYIPLLIVFLYSLVKISYGALHITFEHYFYFFQPLFFRIIGNSLLLAFITALICLLLAYPIAYSLAVRIKRYKNIFIFFLILPFWTSLMVQVYSWFFILGHEGLINSLLLKLGLIGTPLYLLNTSLAIYIVMVYCYLPFMIMPLYSSLEKIDSRMFEASADLGASQWQTFKNITVPLSMPGIQTGFFLVFVPSFGEFVVPTLLGGGKQLYVGSLITQYFLAARDVHLGSAFTILSGIILLIAIGILYWYFNSFRLKTDSKEGV